MSCDEKTWNELHPILNNVNHNDDFKSHNRWIHFEWTPKYCWYLIPTIEINTAIKEVAINIFCLGIYISWRK